MKKFVLVLTLLLSLLAVSPALAADAVDVEIREKLFIAQTTDIYLNAPDYIGKTIKYEGIFFSSEYEPTNSMYYTVLRYGPGCCGEDEFVGFEVAWDESSGIATPAENDWVEVIGALERYEENGQSFLRLHLQSMNVLPDRGAEIVTQ